MVRRYDIETGKAVTLASDHRLAIDALFDCLSAHKHGPQSVIHGDFDTKHILVVDRGNEVEVSGIIDWEEARLGDPLFDYGRWVFWNVTPSVEHLCGDAFEGHYGPNASDRLQGSIAEAAIGAIWWEHHHLGWVSPNTLELVAAAARRISG